MSVNVFLPCRRGSQRVPHKNTKPIGRFANGLLELKLLQLSSTREIDRIFVSSDDEKVLGFAQSLKNAKIITHKRDENLCASSTSTDSHHRLFAQKKKGCYPLPAPLSPEKAAAFCAAKSISFGGSASLYPCLGKNAKNALLHSLNAFFLKKLALCHTRQGREAVGAIAPTYCNGAKPSAEFRENIESRVGLGSSSVYRESASPSGVPDALTPNNTLDSKKSAVCSRSGASEDSLLASGSKFARANLHNVIRRAV